MVRREKNPSRHEPSSDELPRMSQYCVSANICKTKYHLVQLLQYLNSSGNSIWAIWETTSLRKRTLGEHLMYISCTCVSRHLFPTFRGLKDITISWPDRFGAPDRSTPGYHFEYLWIISARHSMKLKNSQDLFASFYHLHKWNCKRIQFAYAACCSRSPSSPSMHESYRTRGFPVFPQGPCHKNYLTKTSELFCASERIQKTSVVGLLIPKFTLLDAKRLPQLWIPIGTWPQVWSNEK